MRRVVLQMGMSLDGYVTSDRLHPGTAVEEDEELQKWKLDRVRNAGAHLMGRVAYQEMASFWPHSDHPYAASMNEIPKVVFSTSLEEATWPETRIARGDLAAEIAAVKEEDGPDVLAWGGATFAAGLAAQGLIDEYRLAVQPVAIGEGHGLFADLATVQRLELVETRPFACGVVMQTYRPMSA